MLRVGLMVFVARVLMLAILEQGVADLESPSAHIRSRARVWFLARKTKGEHVFAFTRICREFGRAPAVVRARIFTNVARKPALSLDRQPWRQPAPTAPPPPAQARVAHRPQ